MSDIYIAKYFWFDIDEPHFSGEEIIGVCTELDDAIEYCIRRHDEDEKICKENSDVCTPLKDIELFNHTIIPKNNSWMMTYSFNNFAKKIKRSGIEYRVYLSIDKYELNTYLPSLKEE